MKRFTQLLFIASALFIFSSCNLSKPREVVVNDKFTMMIPQTMIPTKDLNDDACLQYMNPLQELYVIVIEDTYESIGNALIQHGLSEQPNPSFEGFCLLASSSEEHSFIVQDDRESLVCDTINGMNARLFENKRSLNNVEVYYKIALLEGQSSYYQIISWTLPEKEKDHGEHIDGMIRSFKEL